jgi:hypothetical protein
MSQPPLDGLGAHASLVMHGRKSLTEPKQDETAAGGRRGTALACFVVAFAAIQCRIETDPLETSEEMASRIPVSTRED